MRHFIGSLSVYLSAQALHQTAESVWTNQKPPSCTAAEVQMCHMTKSLSGGFQDLDLVSGLWRDQQGQPTGAEEDRGS